MPVRGCPGRTAPPTHAGRSVLACTGHPLSKPLQNQGSATLGNPKNFSLPHTRGHDHLAAVSFNGGAEDSPAS